MQSDLQDPLQATEHGNAPLSGAAPAIRKSRKLDDVCYDIRGPVLQAAQRLEDDGHRILKLNIGNPAPFGFTAPEEITRDVLHNLKDADGYCDARGLFPARKAVMQYSQQQGIAGVDVDHVYMGNGVSELIVMAMQALLDSGDEVLVPAPDYPLWTAAVRLAGGTPVHYLCDEGAGWLPDLDDIRGKTNRRTRALVLINPNNPTGAVYPPALLDDVAVLCRQHNLVLCSDEIYDKILYDGVSHTATASRTDEVLCLTFNGLSKNYRAAGYRTGWLVVSGARQQASDYIEGLDMLANMRLCANVPSQFAVQTALGGYQSVRELVAPDGRWTRQRDLAWERLVAIPGVSCVKPQGALYLFPRLDPAVFNIHDDEQLVLDLLESEHILVVQGTAFNWPQPDHLRLVFLPQVEDLAAAMDRIGGFLAHYRQ